mgnify:CR=1 FL=1
MTGCGKFSGGSEKNSGPSEIFSGSEGTGKNVPVPIYAQVVLQSADLRTMRFHSLLQSAETQLTVCSGGDRVVSDYANYAIEFSTDIIFF